MDKQYMPIEKVIELFGNRYIALRLAAREARKIIEAQNKGEAQLPGSPYYRCLRRLVDKEIEYEVAEQPETEPAPESA